MVDKGAGDLVFLGEDSAAEAVAARDARERERAAAAQERAQARTTARAEKAAAKFARADDVEAWKVIANTAVAWVVALGCCYYAADKHPLACAAAFTFLGLVMTRIFIVYHDMAHHSFFSSLSANKLGSHVLGEGGGGVEGGAFCEWHLTPNLQTRCCC